MAWLVKKGPGWLVRWRDENDRDGKGRPKVKSRYFPTLTGARVVLERKNFLPRGRELRDILEPFVIEASAEAQRRKAAGTVAGYIRTILDADDSLAVSTQRAYGHTLRNHIDGSDFGSKNIRDVKPLDIREYWAGLKVGPGAKRNIYQVLSRGFVQAENDGLTQGNTLKRAGIKKPSKRSQTEILPLPVADIEALAAHAYGPRERLVILLAAYCGLRAGEIGGVRQQDIDFGPKKCSLTVNLAVQEANPGWTLGPPKTRASRRRLAAACSLMDEVARFVKENPPADDGRIFHGRNGQLMHHQKLNKIVQAAAKRAGLRPIHIHELRHTCASLLIDAGLNLKALSVYMGHTSIQMTGDTYGHLYPGQDEQIAASMEARRKKYRDDNGKAAS